MVESLYIGATGLHAQQLQVDTVANNLANVSTPAYKRSRVAFQDVLYREERAANGLPGSTSNVLRMGAGVIVASAQKLFAPGDLRRTDNPFDLAIRGEGFLEIERADGSLAYTRAGHLSVNREGALCTADGQPLRPALSLPPDARSFVIAEDGAVSATFSDGRADEEIGRLELVTFAHPAGLLPLGENLYATSESSGPPQGGTPGEDSRGRIAQGYLEGSNVKLVDEMVSLMLAQRGYELSAKVIQASDELMALSNNLRR